MEPLSLLWLRRDLRLDDHAALACALDEPGHVQPVFVFDTDILARFNNPRDRRLTFIAEALCAIHAELRERGGGLLVLSGNSTDLIPTVARSLAATRVVAEEDYEPATRERDDAVSQSLCSDIDVVFVKDHVLMSPTEVLREGEPYRVFTPYAKAWQAKATDRAVAPYATEDRGRYANLFDSVDGLRNSGVKLLDPNKGATSLLAEIGYQSANLAEWTVDDGRRRLARFVKNWIEDYPRARDMVGEDGTSKLSPYLRHGLVSVRECLQQARAADNGDKWISELIWRDFYAMVLYHFPETVDQEFLPDLRKIEWSYDKDHFRAWCDGLTGYPLVDAGMRQLRELGWMHNRSRMITASFLTKDLHIDWRWGEEHFAQWLMDYELASNAGGWQWSASTGTDAQPWFRIFNPVLQSKKFDPDGTYIRRWVPELAEMDASAIHEPWKHDKPAAYPDPIVDHFVEREETLRRFSAATGKPATDRPEKRAAKTAADRKRPRSG